MPTVAYATAAQLPAGDEDAPVVRDALAAHGVACRPAVWDDPAEDWGAYDLVLVRSVWDYPARRDGFLAWADAVPRLQNPAPVLRWNTDKAYLRELAGDGVPVVPTTWVAPGEPEPALEGEVVVKPTVSAGGMDTGRFGPDHHDAAREHLRALLAAGRTVMVQPYLPAVDTAGETAVFAFGGDVSHALRKGPVLRPDEVAPVTEEDGVVAAASMFDPALMSDRVASAAERALAEQVLAAVRERFGGGELPYARVDMVPGADGAPVLMELEATEPSLYLQHAPGAPDRFAHAILRHMR